MQTFLNTNDLHCSQNIQPACPKFFRYSGISGNNVNTRIIPEDNGLTIWIMALFAKQER
jgi:hypothetical protein